MKIVIVTQDEPFFLGSALKYLLNKLDSSMAVVSVIMLSASPFGRKMSFFSRAFETLKIFGVNFFLHYSVRFLMAKILKTNAASALSDTGVPLSFLKSNINSQETLDGIRALEPDVVISIAANQIFKKELLSLARLGCINLHTGMLPKYRGLMPTFWAMKNGESSIGVTVFMMDEGIDSGPILVQKLVSVGKKSQSELIRETKEVGMDAIVESLIMMSKDAVETKENNDAEMSYFGFPTRKDVKAFIAAGNKFF